MTATLEIQRRFLPIDETKVDKNTLTFSFSSEAPVARYFGEEVLDHEPTSINLSRLNSNAAPLLFNHDPNIVLGKVSKAWVENKRGMATIKWATNEKAKEVRKDVEEGILESISVGYVVDEMKADGEAFRATSWSPHELSIVSIPADQSVGINRSLPVQHPSPKKEMSYVNEVLKDPLEDSSLPLDPIRQQHVRNASGGASEPKADCGLCQRRPDLVTDQTGLRPGA